jgi:hypothetical protein
MRQITIRLRQAVAVRGDQAPGQTHGGGYRDLLSQHRADCQLETVPLYFQFPMSLRPKAPAIVKG